MHEGKNVETLLVGRVHTPLNENEFQRDVLKSGINSVRRQLVQILPLVMEKVRKDQLEKNPSNPKSFFGKNLLSDLDEAMGNLSDVEDGRYELRFYSAKDTMLDFAGSFDCWVEVYDFADNRALADFKIDVTTNPAKKLPSNLADTVLYCDTRYINDDVPGRIEKDFFNDPEYRNLVDRASKNLIEHSHLQTDSPA